MQKYFLRFDVLPMVYTRSTNVLLAMKPSMKQMQMFPRALTLGPRPRRPRWGSRNRGRGGGGASHYSSTVSSGDQGSGQKNKTIDPAQFPCITPLGSSHWGTLPWFSSGCPRWWRSSLRGRGSMRHPHHGAQQNHLPGQPVCWEIIEIIYFFLVTKSSWPLKVKCQ